MAMIDVVFVPLMVLVHIIEPEGGQADVPEAIEMFFFLVGVPAGLLVAWWREGEPETVEVYAG
ncbi:hypothetical protein KKG45_04525 [bacterium]|nr:hypothetical protein [bacterium]MBU1072493.1 hypothetical protein [bacterium]MBU1675612.1 hypothetical protein [bacterium]